MSIPAPSFTRLVRNNWRAIEEWNADNQRAMDANWHTTHCEVCHIRKRDQSYRRCWSCRKAKREAV